MKGLILNDLYMMKKYCRSMLLIAVIFLAAAVVNPGSPFFLLYPAVFAGMMPVTLISYDEKFRWNSYCRVLPYSAKQIVFSKYLLIILLTAALLIIYSILAIVLSAAGTGINMEFFTLLSVIFTLSVAGPSLILPFIFRYGVEKGRIVFYIVIILLCALSAGMSAIDDAAPDALSAGTANILMTAATVIIFILSYLASLKCFKAKSI